MLIKYLIEISDERSPSQIADMLRKQGYEPVWKDWDSGLIAHDPE